MCAASQNNDELFTSQDRKEQEGEYLERRLELLMDSSWQAAEGAAVEVVVGVVVWLDVLSVLMAGGFIWEDNTYGHVC